MVIPLNIEPSQIIRTYLLCLNPMMKLKRREIEVLESMIKVYISLKRTAMSEEEIDSRINDSMGRKVIRDLINMSERSHNNHIMQLKKKRVLTEDNKLQKFLKTIESEIKDSKFSIDYKVQIHPVKKEALQEVKTVK